MFTTRFLDIPPLQSARGTVRLPGSKSISNRVLLLAAFSEGSTLIHHLLESDDTQVMLDALRALGCGVQQIDNEAGAVRVDGLGARAAASGADLFLGNSGTSMRSLTAALAVVAAAQGARFTVRGVARMHERPIGDLVDALRPLGCPIEYTGRDGFPPLAIGDGRVHALNLADPIHVRGDVSSQFLTGLLQALCLVRAEHDVTIEVIGELISKPYIEITLKLLAQFGVAVRNMGWSRFVIPAGSRLRSPGELHVEGDASSASYFVALGALAADASAPLRIEGMGRAAIQGDVAFVAAAQAMGARVSWGEHWVEVSRGEWPLRAVELDCNHMPDAAMTLAVMALYARGATRLTNIASWRVKETDRLAAMANELRKLGAHVDEGPDWIAITAPQAWRAASIETYDDHRIAMCCSLAAFNPLASTAVGAGSSERRVGVPVRILGPRCVAKTFPDYFETLFDLVTARTPDIPVIAIDGPSASGKGTLAGSVAAALGYHQLDSGALYRATAWAAMQQGVSGDDEQALARLAESLDLRFSGEHIRLGGTDVTDALRREDVGALASKVAAWPQVRDALRALQLSFRRLPGLVADGRDMGTVVFPTAALKVFLTASAATRAERRHKQLISKGIPANIDSLRADLEARDVRDQNRSVAPLKPADDAVLLDNSALSIEASVDSVLEAWQRRRPFAAQP
jgi:3-phosphoshikimate 1-carboxyvinyltransferase